MKRAFSLIELIISISILSLMMIFLYKSYASLNLSNKVYEKKSTKIKDMQEIKKIIFLDFSLKLQTKYEILNRTAKEDVVFFQTSNSIHKNYNPYVAYVVKESKLYRLESLRRFEEYPLSSHMMFDIYEIGDIDSFRVYKSRNQDEEIFLVHVAFKNKEEMVLKIRSLNEK